MSYRSLYEVVPLMSSGLLRSTGAGRPCRSFAAVARVMANAASPSVIRGDPWSLGVIPLEDIVFSRSALRNTSRMMREMDEEMTSMLQCLKGKHQRPAEPANRAKPAPAVGMTVEVKEDKNKLTFQASLPGFAKKDIKVKVTKDRVLVISGQHTANHEATESGHTHAEQFSRTFTRRYRLPDNTETDKISAQLQDGLLTLTVPKADLPEVNDQEITIQETAQSSASDSGAGVAPEASTQDGTASAEQSSAAASSSTSGPGQASDDKVLA